MVLFERWMAGVSRLKPAAPVTRIAILSFERNDGCELSGARNLFGGPSSRSDMLSVPLVRIG